MLLPALNKARERAKNILCVNNVKTLGTAHQFYMDESGWCIMDCSSKISGLYGYSSTKSYWMDILFKSAGKKMFICPSYKENSLILNGSAFDPVRVSYGINAEGLRRNRRGWDSPDEKNRLKSSLIRNPGRFYLFMDSADCGHPQKYGYFMILGFSPSSWSYVGMPNLIRHAGSGNIAFFDGHAATVNSKMYLNPWGAGAFGNVYNQTVNWTYDGNAR